MKRMFFRLLMLTIPTLSFSQANYLDNHSCKECHEKIYDEFQSSMHAKGYFNDTLHRQIADKVSMKKYDCATCHMPMANNLKALISGEARPDKNNKTHTDAISCYFCHTIAYVKKAHRFNVNIKAKQAANYKPTLYGRLENPDQNDKHSSVKNPIYAQKVCTGCHSHKLNENNVTIFHAMQAGQNSESCIKCHMSELDGGSDKINKKARTHHASHKFLGIRDAAFRKKGIDLNVTLDENGLQITMHNKMAHPLIIQSARAKYLKIEIVREGNVIWKNYQKDPEEDKEGYFAASFTQEGHPVIIPYHATEGVVNNIGAEETKTIHYSVPPLKKGDRVTVGFYVQLAKSACAKAIDLKEKEWLEPLLIQRITLTR